MIYNINNNTRPILYLDSSNLLRNNSLHYLLKHFSKNQYMNNPNGFINNLNKALSFNIDNERNYHNLLYYLLTENYVNQIITMDFTLFDCFSKQILNLFGYISNHLPIKLSEFTPTSICFFNENISIEIYKLCYSIIKNEYLIIVDDTFLSLDIGQTIYNKSNKSLIIPLSELSNDYISKKYKAEDLSSALIKFFNLPHT